MGTSELLRLVQGEESPENSLYAGISQLKQSKCGISWYVSIEKLIVEKCPPKQLIERLNMRRESPSGKESIENKLMEAEKRRADFIKQRLQALSKMITKIDEAHVIVREQQQRVAMAYSKDILRKMENTGKRRAMAIGVRQDSSRAVCWHAKKTVEHCRLMREDYLCSLKAASYEKQEIAQERRSIYAEAVRQRLQNHHHHCKTIGRFTEKNQEIRRKQLWNDLQERCTFADEQRLELLQERSQTYGRDYRLVKEISSYLINVDQQERKRLIRDLENSQRAAFTSRQEASRHKREAVMDRLRTIEEVRERRDQLRMDAAYAALDKGGIIWINHQSFLAFPQIAPAAF